jgi:vanillate O-demethylase ferredoxin subunit
MTKISVTVAAKRVEADSIVSFTLRATDGAPLPAFDAGAHIDVHLPIGLTRQYSLCNAPTDRAAYQIAVLREPAGRGGSAAMHDTVHEGDALLIGAPRNLFPLHAGHESSILLAGGIGITPILAMAEHLHAQNRTFRMHYCVRDLTRAAFLDRIRGSAYASALTMHVDSDGPESRLDLRAELASCRNRTHLYVCGPRGFIDHVIDTATLAGVPADCLHVEHFSAQSAASGETAFEVELASSGQRIHVPANESVAQALQRHGVDVPLSCEQGICGTCLTPVLAGQPDHRDQFLTAEEHAANDQFTPCCSRSKTEVLVLGL